MCRRLSRNEPRRHTAHGCPQAEVANHVYLSDPAALTLLAYVGILRNGFINFDDNEYVAANPRVIKGLSWDEVVWTFTTAHSANLHPLTWLSHMLDCSIFGLQAWGHHLTSLLLHITNTLVLFLGLRRMTKALWRSAFVAALFALHPLHVESVAWVSERKDVLSALFFFLTLLTYATYAEDKAARSMPGSEGRGWRDGSPRSEIRSKSEI